MYAIQIVLMELSKMNMCACLVIHIVLHAPALLIIALLVKIHIICSIINVMLLVQMELMQMKKNVQIVYHRVTHVQYQKIIAQLVLKDSKYMKINAGLYALMEH